ncbi:diguanylate cyclase [Asanoa sp. WMMD1127]|uniref:diguanylate cyclase n=1 Tax=Asanoa sp. WMMD1127 TaxID=3016107 RepID=UPI002416DCF9|nr:diguanylate cyclase [Asanoa sp. WMMD1127]MDG4821824.1 diguanylate cyclase [Asanoa sp. WMMD1127]
MSEAASLTSAIRRDRVLRWAAGVGAAWLVLFVLLLVIAQVHPSTALVDLPYLLPIVVAVGASAVAAVVTTGRTRSAWVLLAVSNALWLAGEIIWVYYTYVAQRGPPAVSSADLFYLLSYVVAIPAILVGIGSTGHLRHIRGLLDAGLLALGLGTIGWQVAISPSLPQAPRLADFVAFAYPLFGVAIVTTLAAVGLAGRHRLPAWGALVGAAFAVAGVTDAVYAYSIATQNVDGNWINMGWQIEAVLFSLAAVAAIRRPEPETRKRDRARDLTAVPLVVAAVAVAGLILADRLDGGPITGGTLAVLLALFAGLLARQLLTIRDRTRLAGQLRTALREQERLAITDGLTGVYNRRFFQEMLRIEAERAERAGTPLSLILIDLDEFKKVNDGYGHPAGDVVLAQIAERIRGAVRASDVVARYGGEEFGCLLPGVNEEVSVEIAEQIRQAIARGAVGVGQGRTVTLTSSLGVATAGTRDARPATEPDGLVHDADTALYRAKATGRNRVVAAGMLSDPVESDPDLPIGLVWLADRIDAQLSPHEHSTAVSRWSLLVAERLGLDMTALRRVAAAGRLHDIGKVTVADSVLRKATPLTPVEWEQLRRHPGESARLLDELGHRPDLAAVVGAHHERFDGTGYPRRLAGEQIPIEARIVTVTDAWAAMLADRPYAPALSVPDARAEIESGRGTQFDPAVADVFLALETEGLIGDLSPREPSGSVW